MWGSGFSPRCPLHASPDAKYHSCSLSPVHSTLKWDPCRCLLGTTVDAGWEDGVTWGGPQGEETCESVPCTQQALDTRSLITWAPSQGLWGLPLPHLGSTAQVEHPSPICKPSKLLPLSCAPSLLLDTTFWGSGALGAGFAPWGGWRWCRRAASCSVLWEP